MGNSSQLTTARLPEVWWDGTLMFDISLWNAQPPLTMWHHPSCAGSSDASWRRASSDQLGATACEGAMVGTLHGAIWVELDTFTHTSEPRFKDFCLHRSQCSSWLALCTMGTLPGAMWMKGSWMHWQSWEHYFQMLRGEGLEHSVGDYVHTHCSL